MKTKEIEFALRQYNQDDEAFFNDVQFEMYKFEIWHEKDAPEEEIRHSYQEYILSDPLNHTGVDHQVYVIETKAGNKIGLIWIAERKPFWKYESTICWIYNLYVNPDYRLIGLGKLLMTKVEEWAKNRSLSKIGLHVADFNTSAIKLYEKMGYSLVHTHNWSCFFEKEI